MMTTTTKTTTTTRTHQQQQQQYLRVFTSNASFYKLSLYQDLMNKYFIDAR
jgi:hypothetical protein